MVRQKTRKKVSTEARDMLEFNDPRKIDYDILNPQPVIVKLYILEAYDLMSRDDDGNSDPYLKIQLGRKKINTEKDYFENTTNPKFYNQYEFKTELPGVSTLSIELWDKDLFSFDDLIGETKIEIEDRFFSSQWR